MITKYDKYISQVNDFEQKKKDLIEKLKQELLTNIENEFSKYYKYIHPYKTKPDFKLFLIDEDYGLFINVVFYPSPNRIEAYIYTAFKDNRGWTRSTSTSASQFTYTKDKGNVTDFVKNVVDILEKRNVKRKIAKEKRELKRATNKYNL